MSTLVSIISKLFGSKSDRDIKAVMPVVETIKASYEKVKDLDNNQLRGKTQELRKYIKDNLAEEETKIKQLIDQQ